MFGIWPALLTSVLSFLAYNFFFIEPHYTFSVSQPHELLALFIFLIIAVLTATLAGRARLQATKAIERAWRHGVFMSLRGGSPVWATRRRCLTVPCSACPRLTLGITPSDLVVRLIEAEAWVELGLWLIGWELPDWSVHQLCRGDHS